MIYKSFNNLPRLIQALLLLIPGVNWITEILVRWSNWLRKKGLIRLILALAYTIFGIVLGYLDLIWVLLFKHLFWAD